MSTDKKQRLIAACKDYVEERIQKIRMAIADLEDALKLETKCSAGDKYETGRAMLHLEFEKLSVQLEQYGQLKKTISLVENSPSSSMVAFGSVVETGKAFYIIAIPAGKLKIDGKEFFAVGANSPIAQAMMGRMEGETFVFNGEEQSIQKVY